MKIRSTPFLPGETEIQTATIALRAQAHGCNQNHGRRQGEQRVGEAGAFMHCWWEREAAQTLWRSLAAPLNIKYSCHVI